MPVPQCGGSRPFASCLRCWLDEDEAGSSGCGHSFDPRRRSLRVRPGDTATLTWEWGETKLSPLYTNAFGIDWSQSPDAALLDTLEGEVTIFTAPRAGMYEVVARAVLPPTPEGQAFDTVLYTIEAVDRATVTLDVGEEPLIRMGTPAMRKFRALVNGTSTGDSREVFRFSWAEVPAGNEAPVPAVFESQEGYWWWFQPDLRGEYRAQLEYSDGLDFTEPVVSAPITAIDGPIVSVEPPEWVGVVGEAIDFRAALTYTVQGPVSSALLTLAEQPEGSMAYFEGQSYQATLLPDMVGTYVIEVVGVDAGGEGEPVKVTVTIR